MSKLTQATDTLSKVIEVYISRRMIEAEAFYTVFVDIGRPPPSYVALNNARIQEQILNAELIRRALALIEVCERNSLESSWAPVPGQHTDYDRKILLNEAYKTLQHYANSNNWEGLELKKFKGLYPEAEAAYTAALIESREPILSTGSTVN